MLKFGLIKSLFRRPSFKKPVVVVEIGNDWLKVAENTPAVIGRTISKVNFTKLAQIDAAVSSEVAKIFKELGLSKEGVIIYIPRNLVTIRILELPSTDPREINDMVNLQVSKQTPYSKEEIFSTHKILDSGREGYTKVMLVIARRNIVTERVATLQSAGIDVGKVAVSTEGVYNWFTIAYMQEASSDTFLSDIILDVDSNYSDFIVIRKKELVFTRSILIGANQLLEEFDKWQDKFIEEVKHSLELYQSEEKGVKAVKIFLSGAGKNIKDLANLLSARLDVPVEPAVEVKNMRLKDGINVLQDPNFNFISVSALFGIAIKHKEISLDLTPPELRIQINMAEKSRQLLIMGILFTSIVMVSSLFILTSIYSKNSYLSELKDKIAKIEKDATAVEKMRLRINMVEKRLNAKAASINILNEIYKLTPKEMYLTSINIEEKNKTILRGRANAMSDVFKYVTTLEASDLFDNVSATYTSTKKENNIEYTEFEITCFNKKD